MIDLRSDTVTHPTPAMRQAMFEAAVGDDQYGEDPTVNQLEARAAELVGKEAAVLVVSGTMGNLSSVLAHCGRGDEAIVGDESHILWYESGGASAVGGIPFFTLDTDRFGRLNPDDVAEAIRPPRAGYPRTGVVCLESTHNRCGGVALELDYLADIQRIAHDRDIPVHLDGARIFNAAAALDSSAAAIAANVDSVQFCLSKGLAAPVGSLVAGSADFVDRVRRQRKLLGGAMRQAGVVAAAGLVALNTMIERLPQDHMRARILADGLSEIDGIVLDRETVQSNIIVFRVEGVSDHSAFIEALREYGVLLSNYGLRGARMVTHYEIDDDAVETALNAIDAVMQRGAYVHA